MRNSTLLISLFFLMTAFIYSCGDSGNDSSQPGTTTEETPTAGQEVHGKEIKAGDIQIATPLNAEWVTTGKATYDLKCQSCHKLTDERLVGPGWKGVTKRREPHWIMNMVTNVDMMLEKDPEAQKLLEQCLVRMPNQNLTFDQARQVLEFMRSNDGEK